MKWKKQTWVLIIIIAAAVISAVVFISMQVRTADIKDAMFYEVKCQYPNENQSYSMIVDHKPAALAFKEDMETTLSDQGTQAKCDFIAYPRATNDALFMYAIVTVLNNVTFAFKEESIKNDTYQIQFFTAKDEVAAMSCRYKNSQFNCYHDLPVTDCPAQQADAIKLLKNVCEYKSL